MSADPTTEHPAELVARAEELERDADVLWRQVKEMRGEAAKLRERSKRIYGELEKTGPKRARTDPMLAAAGLACEDMPAVFTHVDIGVALRIRDEGRLVALMLSLEALGMVRRTRDGRWRSVDPEEARVRDAVIALGTFTEDQLAEHLEVHPRSLIHYLQVLRDQGQILDGPDGAMSYQRPGPERVQSRRRRFVTPEREAVAQAGYDVPGRGQVVEFTGKGTIPNRGSQPKRHADIQRRRAAGRKGKVT